MLPTLVLLLVSGSAFCFGLVITTVLAKAWAQYQERYVARSLGELSEMFLFIDRRQLLALAVACMCLLGLLAWAVFNPLLGLLATGSGFFLPGLLVRFYRRRRIRRFDVQLVEALQALASALKAGLSFPQALEHVAREAAAPLGQELGLLVKELKLGVPLEDALAGMGRRVGSEDLELVVVSANISRQLGGNLAEMFETLSQVLRERFRLEGRVEALTSQGRLQGWVVAAMPLVLGLALDAMRPDLMRPMLGHPFGFVLVALVVGMEALGVLLIRRIVNIDL